MDNQAPSLEAIQAVAKESIVRLKAAEAISNWQSLGEEPCKLFKAQVDGKVIGKGEATLNFKKDDIVKFLCNDASMPKYDQGLEKQEILKKYNNNVEVFYNSYYGDENFSSRDFVMCSTNLAEGDKFYISSSSCNYPYPQVAGKIRAVCHLGGFIIQKVSEEQAKLIYIGQVDMKGELSEEFKQQVDEYQGVVVSRVEAAMKAQ